MTRDEGVALIKQQLSFRTTLDSAIVTWLQFAQTNLEAAPTKPWFLVSEDSFTNLTVDEERVPLPTDFLQEVEEATFKYRPDDYPTESEVDLKKDEYDQLRKDFVGVEAGPPQAYALLGDYFRVFPLPDDDYQVRLIYYKRDTLLTTNVENGWLKHVPLLLLGSAGKLIGSGPLRDKGAMDIFDEWVRTGMALLTSQNEAREMANRSGNQMQIGGRHY